MTDEQQPPAPTSPYVSPPPPSYAGQVPATFPPPGAPVADGPIGTVRSTGVCILLTIVTLGFYTWYWYYVTHDEMKRHTGQGTEPAIALVLGILISIVMAFLTPNDVGAMYRRKGMREPVSAVTGLWALLLGWFFFVGAIVWFVKTNGALNAYWRSQGARG
ncbi:hypothetical protein GCM10011519_34110 [Marmoricola endophyticus]|uniref:DUF4234 domain-containing protein n=1 Tax=Marmoricola endophyticus TaxID=2040280 RepID=A0A917BVL6_9ACTN|nr:DUF4234 domain-containing protein [Marmoricola endophyticus]GGF57328.1 hypothetical protein GCM10011519_34110 [Marmoricola endophyticus]